MTSVERASLERLPALGQLNQVRPAWATDQHLEQLSALVERSLAPIGWKGAAVVLDRLFAVLPMPPSATGGEDPVQIYIEELQGYPGDILARAVSAVIRRHKWRTPPTIADIVECADADEEFCQRKVWKTAIRVLSAKRMERERVERSPEDRALDDARMAAIREAMAANRVAPTTVWARAIQAAYDSVQAAR